MVAKGTPGVLYVTMQPKSGLTDAQFHDWYQNEHGPNRLRLPFCKNGFRYRAADLNGTPPSKEQPEWMAVYDFDALESLESQTYLRLRSAPVQSQRERDTMAQIHVHRRNFDLIREWKQDDYTPLEAVASEGEGCTLIAVSFKLQAGEGKEEELRRWYDEEHIPLLQNVPGWRRSRRFVTSFLDMKSVGQEEREFLALHEYAPKNGLAGPELHRATGSEWSQKIYSEVVRGRQRRIYKLYYTFGPAQRDLKSLESENAAPAETTDGLTRTWPKSQTSQGRTAIESYVATSDGVSLPYRLEGSPEPDAPLLVLINSILVDYSIWDDFVTDFLRLTGNRYRVLRYNARGRNELPADSTAPVTINVLSSDVLALLDALRVRTASIVGVSLGGATALAAALSHPDRVSAFIACDTNAFAPPSNAGAWNERVAMAEEEAAVSNSGSSVVGSRLADITAKRWFPASSYANPALAPKLKQVEEVVAANSLPGFRDAVKALHAYDLRDKMPGFTGKGAFLVGGEDGVLPKTMKENMAEKLGKGVELKVIEGAGHLPMVEKPDEVAAFVAKFLDG